MHPIDQEILDNLPKPNRTMAPFRWYGGKGNLVKRIIPLLPREDITTYVEPFAGAASVFWALPRPYSVEVLNDLYGDIINLFRCLQNPETFEQLLHRLIWTPYSRAEFRRALEILDDPTSSPLDRAWAFYVAYGQGFSGTADTEGNWSRVLTESSSGMAKTADRWRKRLTQLPRFHDRLTRVQLDSVDALKCIRYWDSPTTLFYLDPHYVHETRASKDDYTHEMSNEQHTALVDTLFALQGKAVLSGYDHPIYQALDEAGWQRVEIQTAAHAAGRIRGSKLLGDGAALEHAQRTEVIWLSPSAQAEQRLL
jgi:DNA adenine methylase